MATKPADYFIVGDIQGNYTALRRLLDKADFCERKDVLVSVGDMVARGEDSLATVRFLHGLGESFKAVLGNHDLHLLAVSQGIREAKSSDRLASLLKSEHLPEWEQWLRQMPLALALDKNTVVVHAGLYPEWSLSELLQHSEAISKQLTSADWCSFIAGMYGNQPNIWSPVLTLDERHRFIVNACTRMRFLFHNRALDFDCKEHPNNGRKGLLPWFEMHNPYLQEGERIIFGHWASLMGETHNTQFVGLDHGYVWGGSLSGYWLSNQKIISVTHD